MLPLPLARKAVPGDALHWRPGYHSRVNFLLGGAKRRPAPRRDQTRGGKTADFEEELGVRRDGHVHFVVLRGLVQLAALVHSGSRGARPPICRFRVCDLARVASREAFRNRRVRWCRPRRSRIGTVGAALPLGWCIRTPATSNRMLGRGAGDHDGRGGSRGHRWPCAHRHELCCCPASVDVTEAGMRTVQLELDLDRRVVACRRHGTNRDLSLRKRTPTDIKTG